MTRFRIFWLLARLGFINTFTAAGAIAITIAQWPQAVSSSCFLVSGCAQGLVGTIFLAVFVAGIPVIIFAIIAHAGLSWLLLRPGELDEYKARKIIKNFGKETTPTTSDGNIAPKRVFED